MYYFSLLQADVSNRTGSKCNHKQLNTLGNAHFAFLRPISSGFIRDAAALENTVTNSFLGIIIYSRSQYLLYYIVSIFKSNVLIYIFEFENNETINEGSNFCSKI